MNKLIISFTILFGLLKPAMAQPLLNDSSEIYNYWAQRGIIEMIYAHMEDYIEKVDPNKSINEITRKKDYNIEFINKISKDSLPELEDVSVFLKKHNWENFQQAILQQLINNYKNREELNYTFFDLTKSGNDDIDVATLEGAYWNNKRKELLENYERDLLNLASIRNSPSMNLYEYDEHSGFVVSSKELIIYSILLLIGILLGVWLTYSFSKRKIYSILEEEKIYYLDYKPLKTEKSIFRYITLFHILKRRKDSYKRHNKDLKRQIEELESESKSERKPR